MAGIDTMSGMIGEGKARLQATVTEEEKAVIEKLAEVDDRTVSNFVSRIVREWLKENGHTPVRK